MNIDDQMNWPPLFSAGGRVPKRQIWLSSGESEQPGFDHARKGSTLLWAIALVFVIATIGARADNYWPGLLGPERNGWVSYFEAPNPWPEQMRKVWQVEVGSGYGTPILANDRIYQHARVGENEVLWCLDLATGSVKWWKTYPVPFKMGGGGEWHGKGPKSCPILADGRVFTMGITGVLTAWDASSGDLLWQRDYGSRFEKPHPYWGATTSPIVDANRVVVHFGGDDQGVLVALDVKTGEEGWHQGEDGAAYSSPLVAEIHGTRQIVEWNHEGLAGVESVTGRLLWEFSLPHIGTNQNMPTPSIHRDHILVGGENRGLRSIRIDREGEHWTATEMWLQKKAPLDMSSAVINGERLYGFTHYNSGSLFCLDVANGNILWEGPARAGDNATLLATSGYVLVLLDSGELQVIEATDQAYRQVVSYQVADTPTWAPPVLMTDGLLVKDKETLTLWSLDASDRSPTAPAR